MKPRTIRYLANEGWRGAIRHRGMTFTAVATMTASLLVLGVFMVVAYNVRGLLEGLEHRKEVVVYLQDGLDSEAIAAFEQRLTLHPGVALATFVSREEAWEEFSASMKVEGLQEAVGGNPLPHSYRLQLAEDARDAGSIAGLAGELGAWDEVDEVITGGAWVGRLDRFARGVLWVTGIIGLAVGLSIVAIVANTVRLTITARRDLIEIMKLVGASEAFIRFPFLSEGVLQSFLAGAISLGMLSAATWLVADRLFPDLAFLSPLWCAAFLGFALFLGFTGSLFSVRHVLRKVGL